MTYMQVLEMPLRTFWAFNRQVDPLRAEDEIRKLRVAVAAGSSEATMSLAQTLKTEVGTPVFVEKQFNRAKFEELKTKFSAEKG